MGNFSIIEIIYWAAAIIGGTLFILRTILLLLGADHFGGDIAHDGLDIPLVGDFHAGDVGIGHDVHLDTDHAGDISETDFSFKLLSTQGLTAFFMLFGLVGLALLKMDLAIVFSLIGGILAGLLAVLVVSLIFSQMKRLQADGTIKLHNAIGQTGSAYLPIPANGCGQVQVIVQGALKIFDAVSAGEQPIKTGEKIRVTGTVDHKTLIVEKM